MSASSESNDRLDRAVEGMLSREEWERLQREIVADADVRARYVDRMWIHAGLRATRHGLPELLDPVAAPRLPHRQGRTMLVWLAAAAAVTVTIHLSLFVFARADRSVATLVAADHCKWAGSDLPTVVNSKLVAGRLNLVEGIATIEFKRGAVLTLEAPTTLEIIDDMQCRLIEGSVVADVPESAHGFTVHSPDMKVIDLGTRFGLTAGSAGNSHVFVFEGEVKIEGLKTGEPQHLKTGKNFNVISGKIGVAQEPSRATIAVDPSGWLSIATGFGHGKDAYTRRGDSGGPKGHHPLLMVKHTELERSFPNERRAVLTFDLSQTQSTPIDEVELTLDPESSGMGFSTLVPDSRFAIYGIVDENLDSWDENRVLWLNTPGCDESGPLPGQTRRLLEFDLPRGGSGEPLTLKSDALTAFIRSDTNGLASFLIIRETGETDPSGLVHAFASKEHPTALPPTLRIR